MRLLITGATGFVGSHLVTDLSLTGHEIAIIKREHSQLNGLSNVLPKGRIYNLSNNAANIYQIISDAKPDIVIHLATCFISSHKRDDIDALIQSNIAFPTKLLEAMEACGVRRFINTGAFSEQLNNNPSYDPANLYSATKRAFEDILMFYVNAKHFSAVTLKLFDTYGPRDTRPKFFSFLKRSLREKAQVDFSPGEQLLDLIYIRDVTAAYEHAIDFLSTKEGAFYEHFFIGSGTGRTLKDIVRTFEEVAGQTLNINWGGRPYRAREVMEATADIKKASDLLHWQPRFSLEEGLKEMFKDDTP